MLREISAFYTIPSTVIEYATTTATTPATTTRRPFAAKQVRKIDDSEKPKSTPLNEFEWKVRVTVNLSCILMVDLKCFGGNFKIEIPI